MTMYMDISNIMESLNYLKLDINNLKLDVTILNNATHNIERWDDDLKEQINQLIKTISKKLDLTLVEFNKVLKRSQVYAKDVQENYLKKIKF